MDRALASGAKGRGFESLLARHFLEWVRFERAFNGTRNPTKSRIALPGRSDFRGPSLRRSRWSAYGSEHRQPISGLLTLPSAQQSCEGARLPRARLHFLID